MKFKVMFLPTVVAAIGAVFANLTWCQEFKPNKSIEVVVHTGPGGGSDLFARAIAELLQKEKLVSQRLQVVKVDAERGLIAIKGAVPGAPGGDVIVRPSSKA